MKEIVVAVITNMLLVSSLMIFGFVVRPKPSTEKSNFLILVCSLLITLCATGVFEKIVIRLF